jgi:parallel beta-helix repeat protein
MKKTVVLNIINVCLIALGTVYVRPVRAQYQGNITINADGSITPSTAPIHQVGDTYLLTSNVVGTITIHRNNAVFDGNDHTIIGGGPTATITAYGIIYGLSLNQVSNVIVKNFIITNCSTGIELDNTSNVTITNNTITESATVLAGLEPTAGINFDDGSSNIIAENNFANDTVGISLTRWEPGKCSHNLIEGNNFTDCSTVFLLYDSSNNIIYHNNFINNTIILEDTGYSGYGIASVNIWDDGYPSGGNYWSDYLTRYPNATEIGTSGIGDTPYFVRPDGFFVDISGPSSSASNYWNQINAIELNNTDRYPLMEPFTTTPPTISLLSPLNVTYNEANVPLLFTVDKPVNWAGYSLDGNQNVTVIGNDTIANLTNGLHSITVYANDTFGNIGASETIAFTIAKPEPFPTATVAAVSGTSAIVVVVVAGLLVYFKKRKR